MKAKLLSLSRDDIVLIIDALETLIEGVVDDDEIQAAKSLAERLKDSL